MQIEPTMIDKWIIGAIAAHTNRDIEKDTALATLIADERLLWLLTLGLLVLAEREPMAQRQRLQRSVIVLTSSIILPHFLKRWVDQLRPDRTIPLPRHGIPVSGRAYDAFPSGHAVHLGATASLLS